LYISKKSKVSKTEWKLCFFFNMRTLTCGHKGGEDLGTVECGFEGAKMGAF